MTDLREGQRLLSAASQVAKFNSQDQRWHGGGLAQSNGQFKIFVTVGSANADYITDGVADDVQIQAAIDYVNTLGGGTVFVKQGTYNISALITMRSYVALLGDNKRSILRLNNAVNTGMIAGASGGLIDVAIANLEFDGNAANQTLGTYFINIPGNSVVLQNILIENNYIHDVNRHAIFIHGDNTHFYNKVIRNNLIKNHGVNGVGYGIYVDFAPNTFILDNAIYDSNGNDAIEMGNLGQIYTIGNYIEDGQLQFPFGSNSIIAHNIVKANTIQNDANTADNVVIIGNQVLGATPTNSFAGISVKGSGAIIQGNYVKVSAQSGIRVFDDQAVISGNYIDGTNAITGGTNGVYSNTSSNTRIADNYIQNFDTAVRVTHDYNIIHHNSVVACTTGVQLSDSSSSGHIILGCQIDNNDLVGAGTAFTANNQTHFTICNSVDRGTAFGTASPSGSILTTAQTNSGHSEVPLVVENVGTGNSQEWKSSGNNQARMSKAGTLTLGVNGLIALNGGSGQMKTGSVAAGANTLIQADKNNTNINVSTGPLLITESLTVTDGNAHTKSDTVATITSTAVQTSGTVTDTSKILSLQQNFSGSTGTVLQIINAGAGASINLGLSTAPASPADGDIWREDNTNTGLKIRVNGVTKTITLS